MVRLHPAGGRWACVVGRAKGVRSAYRCAGYDPTAYWRARHGPLLLVPPGRVGLVNTCRRLPLCAAFWAPCGVAPIHDEEAVMRLRAVTVLAAIAALVGGATAPALASRPPGPHGPAAGQFTAKIRYTTGGIPHILAHSWADLGFGYGFAFAKDNICTMANDYITVEAQRSRYFGPKGSYIQRGNGVTVNNLDSDFFFQQIIDSHIVQRLQQGLNPDEKQLEAGYVKGYNGYLAHVGGSKGVPDPTCRGQSWVKPITLLDSYLRFYQLMLESSSDVFIDSITAATPPKATQAAHPAVAVSPARPSARSSARSAATRSRSGPRAPGITAACCSATRTSRGSARSASTRRSSRSPARSTSPGRRCTASRSCSSGTTRTWRGATPCRPRSGSPRSSSPSSRATRPNICKTAKPWP